MFKNFSFDYIPPAVFQLSILITLPLLIHNMGPLAIVAILLGPIYHWLAIVFAGHMIISHKQNAGYILNRLFYALFFYTTFITPAAWAAYHIQHHKYTDTAKDPQSPKHHGLKVMFIFGWNPILKDIRTYLYHSKTALGAFYEKYYWGLILFPFLMLAIFPYQYVLLFWMVPASLGLSLGTWSAYYTHQYGEPRAKFSVLNKILLLGEMENHVLHHKNWNMNSKIVSFFK